MSEKEFDEELEELKDALQHKRIRSILWNQVIDGERLIFGKFMSDDTNKVFRWKGERDKATDMLSNIMNADLEMGLQMIRENWDEGEQE